MSTLLPARYYVFDLGMHSLALSTCTLCEVDPHQPRHSKRSAAANCKGPAHKRRCLDHQVKIVYLANNFTVIPKLMNFKIKQICET